MVLLKYLLQQGLQNAKVKVVEEETPLFINNRRIINMNYEKEYQEEVKILNDINSRYDKLSEEDIAGAFQLQKDALQAYFRWSNIKYDIKKNLKHFLKKN